MLSTMPSRGTSGITSCVGSSTGVRSPGNQGSTAGLAFLQGYVVEKSLSMDNIFVIVVIFKFFSVPLRFQYRVLF